MTLRATDEERAEVIEYLEWQLGKGSARKVVVRHVEKITAENITGDRFEVWNCVTNQGKWWVVTPMMNFYTQRDFKSADVVLTFHVGMVGRVMSQDQPPLAPELRDAFSEPWRKWEDAVETMRVAQRLKTFKPSACVCVRLTFRCSRWWQTGSSHRRERTRRKVRTRSGWIFSRIRSRAALRTLACGHT